MLLPPTPRNYAFAKPRSVIEQDDAAATNTGKQAGGAPSHMRMDSPGRPVYNQQIYFGWNIA